MKSAMLVAAVALGGMAASGAARADQVTPYSFSGMLQSAVDGGTSVSGGFDLDSTNATLPGFDLVTPYGAATAANYSASVEQYTPAFNPSLDFTALFFKADNALVAPNISLIFQSPVASFSGGSFYTGLIEPTAVSSTASSVDCGGCLLPGGSGFASGRAVPTASHVVDYSFSGTLANSVAGGTNVTGTFALDKLADTITAFDFMTPYGAATPANYVASITQYTPAFNPNLDFTQLFLHPDDSLTDPDISLIFQGTIADFPGAGFYTGLIDPTAVTSTASSVDCGGCLLPGGSGFASGDLTVVSQTGVPEPSALLLLATGFAGLLMVRGLRPRSSDQR